ncbi:MAG: choice-of-anchor D domain-containing protein, partial [Planctomycetes bacterium]|nr:choice-of-anchor D domain-containing protein [Planctomycetota bacterium]
MICLILPASAGLSQTLPDEYATWKRNLVTADLPGPRDEVYYVQNSFVRAGVRAVNGKFIIGTTGGSRLMYGYPLTPSTSHTNFKVDGTIYSNAGNLGIYIQPTDFEIVGSTLQTTWSINNLTIQQILEPIDLETKGAILIRYLIANNDNIDHELGTLLELDLMIGSNDAAPVADGSNYSLLERDFVGAEMPSFWQAFQYWIHQPNFPGLIGEGNLIGNGAIQPDRFAIGQWGRLQSVSWDYVVPDSTLYNDSAVLIWWNPITLSPGENVEFATLYGTGYVAFNPGDLLLSVSAPNTLQNIDCQLSPNPFNVNVLVSNSDSMIVASNVQTTITLPTGLALAPGYEPTQILNPPNLEPGQNGTANWQVTASEVENDTTLAFSIEVNADNMPSNAVDLSLSIPSIEPAVDLENNFHDFGPVAFGQSQTWQMEVNNIGNEQLVINDISADVPDFYTDVDDYPLTIEGCGMIAVPVVFAPTQNGEISGILTITDNVGRQTEVLLQGIGTAAEISVSEMEHDFGMTAVGAPLDWTLIITNTGSADLQILDLQVTPDPPFTIIQPEIPQTILAPGHELDVEIRFLPQSEGQFDGQLTITSTDPTQSILQIQLSGSGLEATIDFSEMEHHFGAVPLGQTDVWPVTVYNTGFTPRTLLVISSEIAIFEIQHAWNLPHIIQPGDSTQFEVLFTPQDPINYGATITVINDDPFFPANYLSVDGQGAAPGIAFSDTTVNFG